MMGLVFKVFFERLVVECVECRVSVVKNIKYSVAMCHLMRNLFNQNIYY